jgi:hypothetical protein
VGRGGKGGGDSSISGGSGGNSSSVFSSGAKVDGFSAGEIDNSYTKIRIKKIIRTIRIIQYSLFI